MLDVPVLKMPMSTNLSRCGPKVRAKSNGYPQNVHHFNRKWNNMYNLTFPSGVSIAWTASNPGKIITSSYLSPQLHAALARW
jgi:hypothetical protein